MKHPATVTIDDNQQLIACHVQNIRQLVAKLSAYNLANRHRDVVGVTAPIITNAQRIDQLASQLIGQATTRKDPQPCPDS